MTLITDRLLTSQARLWFVELVALSSQVLLFGGVQVEELEGPTGGRQL